MFKDGRVPRKLPAGVALALAATVTLRAQLAPVPGPPHADQPIQLGALRVTDSALDALADPTGRDAPEAERREPPFSNDLIMAETVDENALDEIGAELAAVNPSPPADSAAAMVAAHFGSRALIGRRAVAAGFMRDACATPSRRRNQQIQTHSGKRPSLA